MVLQLQKKQVILLFVLLAVLITLTFIAVSLVGNDSGMAISKAVEGGISPIYGTFDHNVLPWGIDAERSTALFHRF